MVPIVQGIPAPPANRITATLLYFVVAIAPVPFGSTDAPVVAFWCIVLGIALLFAKLDSLRGFHFVLLGLLGVVVAAFAFVLHEQMAERPWVATPHPIWAEASRIFHESLIPSVSIVRNQPFFSLGAPLACVLSLLCGFLVGIDGVAARRLIKVVGWSGGVLAGYGIAAYVLDPTHILWREKEAYQSVLTGTFINRNTAAVYFGSCATIWLVLLMERIRDRMSGRRYSWKKLLNNVTSHNSGEIIFPFSMLFVCLAAMFMTGSRAGVVLSLLALMLAFVTFFRRRISTKVGFLAALFSAVGLSFVLLHIMGAGVVSRFELQGAAEEGRFETYLSTLRMIADRPWFGSGLGTFVWAYPAYRSANIPIWGIWDRAHSTPLELAADLGIPLTVMIAAGWIFILVLLIQGVRVRRRNVAGPLVALSVSLIALIHSTIDFSLQIPGFAIVVFALAGAGVAQSLNGRRRPNYYHAGPRKDDTPPR